MANYFTSDPETYGGDRDVWGAINGTAARTTATANDINGLDGTLTADRLEINSTETNAFYKSTTRSSMGVSTVYYISIFVKADEKDGIVLHNSAPGVAEGQYFNLANGTVGAVYTNAPDDAGIVPYGDGWYRCWIKTVSNATSGGQVGIQLFLTDAGGSAFHSGTSGDGAHFWGIWLDTVNYTDWTTLPYLVGAEEYFHSTGFNTHTFTEPAGAQEDDFFLVQMNARDVSGVHTITEPGDFTVLDEFYETTGSADDLQYIAHKVRGATAGSGYTFSLNVNDSCGYTMSVWRNVNTSNPFDVAYVKGSHYSAATDAVNTAAPAITTNTDNAMVVLLYGGTQVHSADQAGNPSGYNEACRSAMNVDSKNVAVQYKLVTSAGTETPGAFTFATGTTTTDRRAFTLALAPLPNASTHYWAIYSDGNGANATDAEIIAGTGTGIIDSGTQADVDNATAQSFTSTSLVASTNYDLEYVVDDGGANKRAPTRNFRTKAATGSVVINMPPPIVRT